MKIDPYKIKWFYGASRGKNHAVLFVDAVGTLGMKNGYSKKVYGFPYVGKYWLQCQGSRSIGQEDHDAMEKIFPSLLGKRPNFFYEWGVRMEEKGSAIRKFADKLRKTNWQKLDNVKLLHIIEEHCDLQAQIWAVPLAYAYYFYFNDKIVEDFISEIRGRMGSKLDAILPAILEQEKPSEIAEEKKELLTLAISSASKKKTNTDALEKHWKKYAHLNNYYYWGKGYSLEDMEKRLAEECNKSVATLKEEIAGFKQHSLDYSVFTEREKVCIKAMKKLSYAFQHADESLAYCIHTIRGVYNEAAKRLGLTYNEFVSMTLREIEKSVEMGSSVVSTKDLKERYRNHAIIVAGDTSIVLIGKECELYEEYVTEKSDTTVKEFKGVVAFKGKVLRGKVHIISHADEIASFKEGEILVTPMTNPSFVPAMQKALAIITNDGGLLCHAAIVSREMKKPCIIGTKIATKVLKDGDLVEVDAELGVVTILKKNQ